MQLPIAIGVYLLFVASTSISSTWAAFSPPSFLHSAHRPSSLSFFSIQPHLMQQDSNYNDNPDYLRQQLTSYLQKRQALNADSAAKEQVGKVIGGTKGNAILEFVSGSPNKAYILDEAPDVFDYDELVKYGYDHLVEPIMAAGGRRAMYTLMNMNEPPTPNRLKPKVVPKLVIDRTGETDTARYSGLKMIQTLDDDEMGQRLAEIQRMKKEGVRLSRRKLVEEEYDIPFSDLDSKSVSRQTPEWTAEMLDEEGRRAGKAISWARAARAGEFKSDPYEHVNVEGALQIYSIISTLIVAFCFGKATPSMLTMMGIDEDTVLSLLRIPAFGILVTSLISSITAGFILAPQQNRSRFAWFVKGFAGGPFTILQLSGLSKLKTRSEQ